MQTAEKNFQSDRRNAARGYAPKNGKETLTKSIYDA